MVNSAVIIPVFLAMNICDLRGDPRSIGHISEKLGRNARRPMRALHRCESEPCGCSVSGMKFNRHCF
jgi:hypothetical protein